MESVRVAYRESGKIHWPIFLPLAVLSTVAGVTLAYVLFLARSAGLYYIIILPLMTASLLAIFLAHTVTKGKCRNLTVAVTLALAASLIMYFGFYYISMVNDYGLNWSQAPRFDAFLRYVEQRMSTDSLSHGPHDQSRPHYAMDTVLNWDILATEVVTVLCVSVLIVLQRVRRPYCERCGVWMEPHRAIFPVDADAALAEALQTGHFLALKQIPTIFPTQNCKYAVLILETCCSENKKGTDAGCTHLLSIGEATAMGGEIPWEFFGLFRKPRVFRVPLSNDEFLQVACKFPRTLKSQTVAAAANRPVPGQSSKSQTGRQPLP